MAEKKKRAMELPETKGTFQIKGIINGVDKDNFYTELVTKTGKPMRMVNFGVEIAPGKTIYLSLNGMERDEVFFSKRVKEGDKTSTVTERVPWKDRFTFNTTSKGKDFRIIGVNLGLEKKLNEKGKLENVKKNLTDYDACKEISDHMQDGMSVFVKGKIEYSEYNDKHMTKFIPSQISLCKKDVDFEEDDFKSTADFKQDVVFVSIDKNAETEKYAMTAKIITYNSIEETELIVESENLAKIFHNKKKIAPYSKINVWGNIGISEQVEEEEDDDCWGEKSNMDVVKSPIKRELIITGADPKTIDNKVYTLETIEKAIEAMKSEKTAKSDFGESNKSNDSWGSTANLDSDDDEDNDEW